MTKKEFLLWVPHAHARLKRTTQEQRKGLAYGLELRMMGTPGNPLNSIMTHRDIGDIDPIIAVAQLLNPRGAYHISRLQKAATDLRLSRKLLHDLIAAIHQLHGYDRSLRLGLLRACDIPHAESYT